MDDPTGSTASFIRKISSFRTFFCLIVSREGRSSRLLNRTTSQHPPTILRGIVSFRAIYWGRLLWDPVIYIFFFLIQTVFTCWMECETGAAATCCLLTHFLRSINLFFSFYYYRDRTGAARDAEWVPVQRQRWTGRPRRERRQGRKGWSRRSKFFFLFAKLQIRCLPSYKSGVCQVTNQVALFGDWPRFWVEFICETVRARYQPVCVNGRAPKQ